MARIIALYSTVPQSGKSTIANHLVDDHGYVSVKFAGALKAMLYTFLRQYKDDADWAYACIEGDQKEVPIKWLGGRTPRQLMISLGTDWGRDMVDANLWVTAAYAKIWQATSEGKSVVIDDMRFPNEYKVLVKAGAEFIKVSRLGVVGVGGATTEGMLENCAWDLEIQAGDGELGYLRETMDEYLEDSYPAINPS